MFSVFSVLKKIVSVFYNNRIECLHFSVTIIRCCFVHSLHLVQALEQIPLIHGTAIGKLEVDFN